MVSKFTDRGPVSEQGPDIIFLSQNPEEHHQLAMLPVRQDAESSMVNHFAFRVTEFADLKALYDALQPIDGIKVGAMSHGNTVDLL
ncbi:MAG: hypothetical protein CM15mP120_15440 [Pseudomonadota bacterium]|nr:MAG: hypothetical protein CM15mP120_15440 [Pseudomonadota bacterium]